MYYDGIGYVGIGMNGKAVFKVIFMSGIDAVLISFIEVMNFCWVKNNDNCYNAALRRNCYGTLIKYYNILLSTAISISLFFIVMPLAQLPNNFIGIYHIFNINCIL